MSQLAQSAPVVRIALGWRAREVERQSTAPVHFRDEGSSSILLTDDPVQLVYADPTRGFTLPPGRYLRADQFAGRVTSVSAVPQLDALSRERARALLLQIAAALETSGWRRAPGREAAGLAALPVDHAVDRALDAAATRTFGLTGVATWRAPRPAMPWAAPPPGSLMYPDDANRLQAVLSLNTLQPDSGGALGSAHYAVNVDITDNTLAMGQSFMVQAREARTHGADTTLTGWDRVPYELFHAPPRPGAVPATDTATPR